MVMRGLQIEDYQVFLHSLSDSFRLIAGSSIFSISMIHLDIELNHFFVHRMSQLKIRYAELPPIPIQRPSSTRSTTQYLSSFYSELVTNYLKAFPVPNWPGISNEYLSSLPFPSFPPLPNLSEIGDYFTDSIKSIITSTSGINKKRKRQDQDDDSSDEELETKRRKQDSSPDKKSFTSSVSQIINRVVEGVRVGLTDDEASEQESGEEEEEEVVEPIRRYPIPQRFDFFVQETVISNAVHHYFVALKSHFQYWTHKDCVFALCK